MTEARADVLWLPLKRRSKRERDAPLRFGEWGRRPAEREGSKCVSATMAQERDRAPFQEVAAWRQKPHRSGRV